MYCKIIIVIAFFGLRVSAQGASPEYYWRDYDGTIPPDAVIGGLDATKNPLYVGQTFFPGDGILPTTIYRGNKFAFGTARNVELKRDRDTKILCSISQTNKPQWVRINYDKLITYTNCVFIPGGFEVGKALFIGRMTLDGQTVIGKVGPHPGLEVFLNGKHPVAVKDFDILGFCSKTLCNCIP